MRCKTCNRELNKEDIKAVIEDYCDANDNPFDITTSITKVQKGSVHVGISPLCAGLEVERAKVFCKHCSTLVGEFDIEQT